MFKVGDEVVCVRAGRLDGSRSLTKVGSAYVVQRVWVNPWSNDVVLDLVGVDNGGWGSGSGFWGHKASRFRKVQRRDLTAWLSTSNTIEGPIRDKEPAA